MELMHRSLLLGPLGLNRTIESLKADFAGTPFLKVGYDGLYLTIEERRLATRKAIEG